MNKRLRQYLGILSAIIFYFLIHEGAHLIYALLTGTFKNINFMGLGIQIDIFRENMSNTQLGIFCLLGSIATLMSAYVLILFIDKLCKINSRVFKACMYYITIALLLIDPLYLSVLCGFFGGGDMNGIKLIIPEIFARVSYGILLVINGVVFLKIVLPKYKLAFKEDN